MSDSEAIEVDEELPPPRKLVVDSEVFNELITVLVECLEGGVDSVDICIHERDLDDGRRCQITVKAQASDCLGEFESELEESSEYSCIDIEH
jgi:hypothetical protein